LAAELRRYYVETSDEWYPCLTVGELPESVRKNMPGRGTELPVKLAKAYFKALDDLKKAENAIHDYLEETGQE
jgi:hypothetical protein